MLIGRCGGSRGVDADKIAGDRVRALAGQQNSRAPAADLGVAAFAKRKLEIIDGQSAHGASAGRDRQRIGGCGDLRTVDDDEDFRVVPFAGAVCVGGRARLRVAIDDDRIGDRRQRRLGLNGLRPCAFDIKGDLIQPAGIVMAVGIEDRLPQRARAAVVGIDDGEGRKQPAMLERFCVNRIAKTGTNTTGLTEAGRGHNLLLQ